MEFDRHLPLKRLVEQKSLLLLGPRMTGKSTLLRRSFPQAMTIDLLEPQELRRLSQRPDDLSERIRAARAASKDSLLVVIDEVQKLPVLLDVVHALIERDKTLRFVLTGSSARKLRRGDVNLLAGRLRRAELFPIVSAELPEGFGDYRRLLQWGGLPSVLSSSAPKEELLDYVGTYLKEEILAEGLTRNLGAFARFLEVAALANGEQIVFANIASDAELPARTVRDHFQLLEDTLLGCLLPAFRATPSRKAMAAAKFYLFDPGVANSLASRWNLQQGTPEYGRALEHLLFCELRAALSYNRIEHRLWTWRSLSQLEVDFVLQLGDRTLAIEVKATHRVSARDLRGLRALRQDIPHLDAYVVCEERHARDTEDGIRIRPTPQFLEQLWQAGFAR